MSIIFSLPLLLGVLYTLYSVYCLAVNFHTAREMNVPLVIIPVSPENPLWMLLGNRIVSIFEKVFGESHFTRFSIRGWVYYDKHRAALELGDHFAFVTPGKIWFYVCNADTLNEVIHRRNDFPRPLELLGESMLNVFGPNVSTVEGVEWQRHRKITSGPFNEQNSNLVWTESIRQAREVLAYWTSQSTPITDTAKHVRTLSLHVLSSAGFGKSYSFQKSGESPKPGHMFNYKDALAHILDHIMLILVVGPNLLRTRFLPKRLASVGQAMVDFKAYMTDMYNEEIRTTADSKKASANIMTALIRATGNLDHGASSADVEGPQSMEPAFKGLSESEIYGNIFVYNFAGHDTTAITLSWTVYLLAAYPEVQDWIGEEINEYNKDSNVQTWDYSETFPKLKRCLAVLLEVLRLYNPLPGIIKSTSDTSQELAIACKTITIPARARVILHTDAIHTHPKYWGSDSLEWRPQRWIARSANVTSKIEDETLIAPPQGAYAPWSGGPRVCPGKKFGQVEFVAVMATLFREYRVEPVPREHESIQCARARTLAAVKDSGMILLLQMLEPERIGVRWVRQSSKCD